MSPETPIAVVRASQQIEAAPAGAGAADSTDYAAAAQEGERAGALTHTADATCANCGAPLPDRYCGHCGQRGGHSVHSVAHFALEAAEDLTHADSRLWRTLGALLFKPGFLTTEFLAGRRASYLPPLRLYLVMSLVFFLVNGLSQHHTRVVVISAGHAPGVSLEPQGNLGPLEPRPGETLEQQQARLCTPTYQGAAVTLLAPLLAKACRSALADRGHSVREAFLHNLARAMFVFLPLLALIMKALYRRPPRYYIEHLLFCVHNHAFVFLSLALMAVLSCLLPDAVAEVPELLLLLYVPYYLFVAMRRVYGQSRALTFGKLAVLSLAYLLALAVMLLLTSVYSVWSL